MELSLVLLAVFVGYLSGSISYARLVVRLFAPGSKLGKIQITVPDSDLVIESDSISATTVRMQLGAKYGILVSILDMAKAAVPALIFRNLYPEAPYYLIAAAMATVGHNYPIFYRFHGGRGNATILGSMFAIDWLGTLITNIISAAIGIPAKNMLVTTGLFMILMIPWLGIRTREWAPVIYALFVNFLYWYAMAPEVREMLKIRNSPDAEKFQEAKALHVVGIDGRERIDTATVPALQEKIKNAFSRKNNPES